MTVIPIALERAGAAVSAESLVKRYGRQTALAGLDLTVAEGAFYVLVGPNGAGKTTLVRILLDLVRPDSGAAHVFGLSSDADGAKVRANVGYVPEHQDTGYGWLRVGRLLRHHAAYYPSWDEAYAARLVDALELRMDAKFGKLSKGQARRVQLVMALAHRPPLLLLDEPTDGLDPVSRDRFLGLLAEHLATAPATVLVSTHLVHEAERLADHVGVMRDGRLAAQVERSELERCLRRYRAAVPEGWSGAPGLAGVVARRNGGTREIEWTVWGDERAVTEQLATAGATVREVDRLNLEEATLALLTMEA